MHPADVLIFVEDPGAANFVRSLPELLALHRITTVLCAQRRAIEYLTERQIETVTIPPDTSADALLRAVAPRLVVVGTAENPDSLGLHLLSVARTFPLPSVGVVDAFANAEFRFRGRSGDPLAHAPDWILTPDSWTTAAFLELGASPKQVVTIGHPHYDHIRQRGRELQQQDRDVMRHKLFPGLSAGQQVVVFLAEISTGMNPNLFRWSPEYTLAGSGRFRGRTEIVLEEFLQAVPTLTERPYLVLRLHPKNIATDFTFCLEEFNSLSQGGCPLELVFAADAVVGMTTMLLTEAALLGTPTLAILPRQEEVAWNPATRLGSTPAVWTRTQLKGTLSQLLRCPRLTGSLLSSAASEEGVSERLCAFLRAQLAAIPPVVETPMVADTGQLQVL